METQTLPCQDFTHNGVKISARRLFSFLTTRLNIAVCQRSLLQERMMMTDTGRCLLNLYTKDIFNLM